MQLLSPRMYHNHIVGIQVQECPCYSTPHPCVTLPPTLTPSDPYTPKKLGSNLGGGCMTPPSLACFPPLTIRPQQVHGHQGRGQLQGPQQWAGALIHSEDGAFARRGVVHQVCRWCMDDWAKWVNYNSCFTFAIILIHAVTKRLF